MTPRNLIRLTVLVAVGAAAAIAVVTLRDKRTVAIATVADIESQLAALDPVTRAGVIARLSRDAAQAARDLRT